MSKMAEWKGKTFEVSNRKIVALENLSTSVKLSTKSQESENGIAALQIEGFEAQALSFDFVVADVVGVDVRAEYEKWCSLVGQIAPFYLSGSVFGPDNLLLTEVGISDVVLDDFGRMRKATIALSFQEWDGVGTGAKIRASQYVQINSALSIGASSFAKQERSILKI